MQEFALAGCPGPTIYLNGVAASGFDVGIGAWEFLEPKNWAKAAGTVATVATKVVSAPALLVEAIGSGARVDKALVKTFKDQVANLKELAPYVSTIVSFVPGVGSGVSAALNAGLALAEGKSIDAALTAGIKGALPGGALAATAFDTAMKIASGENVGKAALEAARGALPGGEAAQKAFDTGLAVITAAQAQMAKSAPKGSPAANAHDILKDEFAKARPQLEAAFRELDASMANLSKIIDENERLRQQKVAEAAAAHAAEWKAAADKAAADLIALSKLTPKELQGIKDMQALAKLTPDQQKQLVAYATAAKAAADVKTKADAAAADAAKTAAAAKAAAAIVSAKTTAAASGSAVVKPSTSTPATATAPAAPTTATAARGEYGPYPASSGAVHGLGFSWGSDTKWRWFIIQANGRTIAQRGPLWLSDNEALREEAAFGASMLGRGYTGTVTRWDWSGTGWQRARGGALGGARAA